MSQTLTVEPVKTQLSLDPFFVPAGVGPFFELGDHRGYVKVSSQVTEGQFLLAEVHADYLGGVPLHVHHREEDRCTDLSGWCFVRNHQSDEWRNSGSYIRPYSVPRNTDSVAHIWMATVNASDNLNNSSQVAATGQCQQSAAAATGIK